MAQANEEDIYTLAKRFFEQDYHDCGMVKWQGYYLSDHTEDVAQYTSVETQRAQEFLQERQTPEEIGLLLKKAYDDQVEIRIQLAKKDERGLTNQLITGKILGYTDQNDVMIGDEVIAIDTINWCQIS